MSKSLFVQAAAVKAETTTEFSTGAQRSSMSVRFDLLSPIGLRRMAEAAHEGAVKYGDFNHEKGLPISVYTNHALAHVFKYLSGDRSEDHLGHAAWNLMFACHSEELFPHLNTNLRQPGCKAPSQETPHAPQH
jgi:hypothetical protein